LRINKMALGWGENPQLSRGFASGT
jgi:hypothetical protein